jgi:hypothetical protein
VSCASEILLLLATGQTIAEKSTAADPDRFAYDATGAAADRAADQAAHDRAANRAGDATELVITRLHFRIGAGLTTCQQQSRGSEADKFPFDHIPLLVGSCSGMPARLFVRPKISVSRRELSRSSRIQEKHRNGKVSPVGRSHKSKKWRFLDK